VGLAHEQGGFNKHSFKAQNTGAGGVEPRLQGYVTRNDTNNALDTGFGSPTQPPASSRSTCSTSSLIKAACL